MAQFILGTIFGIVLSVSGFSGLAHYLDSGVTSVKNHVHEVTK